MKVEKFFELGRVEGWKEKTGVRTDVSHASLALANMCVRTEETEMEECQQSLGVIGRCGYEDKYRSEPSFVIATFMWKRAGQGGEVCLCFPPV